MDDPDLQSRYKVYRIIQYIKSNLDFLEMEFDTYDLEDMGVSGVLRDMGFTRLDISEFEESLLHDELYALFQENEEREVMRLVIQCPTEYIG